MGESTAHHHPLPLPLPSSPLLLYTYLSRQSTPLVSGAHALCEQHPKGEAGVAQSCNQSMWPRAATVAALTGPPWRPAPFLPSSLSWTCRCSPGGRQPSPSPAGPSTTLDPLITVSSLASLVPLQLLYIPPAHAPSLHRPLLFVASHLYMLNLARQTLKRVPSFQEILQGTMGSAKEEMYVHRPTHLALFPSPPFPSASLKLTMVKFC